MASAGTMPGYFRQKKSGKSSTSKKAGSKSSPTNAVSIGSNITQPPALLAHGCIDLQEDRSKDEEVLRHFDMNMAYGRCLGMSRVARWDRARKLGLNPPKEVEVLLKSGRDGSECLWEGHVLSCLTDRNQQATIVSFALFLYQHIWVYSLFNVGRGREVEV